MSFLSSTVILKMATSLLPWFCVLSSITCIFADQCYPFEADVHLPFDVQDGSTQIGYPINSTSVSPVILASLLDAGKAAMFQDNRITVDAGADLCFTDPMTCENGFTLSFLLVILDSNDPTTNELHFLTSGAEHNDSWGIDFEVGVDFMRFVLNNGSVEYVAQDDTTPVQGSAMHIAVTWDTTTLSLYRGGVLVATNSTSTDRSVSSRTYSEFLIGATVNDVYANGVIDELLFFYEAKSASFVTALNDNYASGVAACKHSCIAVSNDMYTSCSGANMYVQCSNDALTQRACPLGYFWDNTEKECAFGSESASADTVIVTEVQTSPCVPDECLLGEPCENGATCHSFDEGFNCTCAPGYEGGYCEIDIDECASSPCVHGDCVDGVNAYTCDCEDGYHFTHCDEYDGCFPSPCLNGALACDDVTAGDNDTSFECTCAPGYTNTTCNVEIDECESIPCQNDATCTDLVNEFNCTCPMPYIGTLCEDYDECLLAPCQNGGTCTEGATAPGNTNDYTCACAYGFSGVNCEDEDECLTEAVDCQNGGTCLDGDDTWSCDCADGYQGTTCETDIDECASDPCENGGTCEDEVNGYTCTCVSPYDGSNCENYNHCVDNPCLNGTCLDLADSDADSYNCTCFSGFSGRNCSIEDECVTQDVTCQNGGSCQDLEGDYMCTGCDAGYDGQLCDNDIDECAGNPCGQYGTCTDQVNGYECACIDTYIGENCDEFNNCHNITECDEHGECLDLTDDYECECDLGFYDDTCSSEDECVTQSVTCQNGGTCEDTTSDTWECMCATGFYGTNCENEDFCITLDPCQNGASCETEVGAYSCDCANGFEGRNCSTELFCITQGVDCENGGTCNNLEETWECACPEDFVGDTCGITSPCISDPCYDIGTEECEVISETERECHCYDGFRRSDCSRGPCHEEPCNATGTRECLEFSNATHVCECTATYEGNTCSIQKELVEVTGSYRLRQLTYSEEYANTSSVAYITLSELVEEGLTAICECNVTNIVFTSGSVVVTFDLMIAEDADRDDLLDDLEEAAVEGTLIEGYDVSSDEIELEGTGTSVASSSSDDNDPTEDKYKIALTVIAVFCGILIFVAIIIIVFGHKLVAQHRMDKEQRQNGGSTVEMRDELVENEENDDDEEGMERGNGKPMRHPSLAELTGKPKLSARNAADHYPGVAAHAPLEYEDHQPPFKAPAKALPPIRPSGGVAQPTNDRSPPPVYT